jgi:hypothetical protein
MGERCRRTRWEYYQSFGAFSRGLLSFRPLTDAYAETAQRVSLAAPVPDSPRDHEPLVVKLDGAAGLAEVFIGVAVATLARSLSLKRHAHREGKGATIVITPEPI